MSVGVSTATLVGVGGMVAGGLAGAMGSKSSNSQTSGVNLTTAGTNENDYLEIARQQMGALRGYTDQLGPNGSDITNSLNSSRSLADMLGQYSQSGGLPSASDISTSNGLASSLFAPQQTALNQSFIQQGVDANRLAASLGRSVDDPILQAKLRTGFMNQQAGLNANQGQWATQFAMGLPGQRLNYAAQKSDILSNLATQAMTNRSTLLGLGTQLGTADRNFRLASSERYGTSSSQQGGGVGDMITGAMGGFGTGASVAHTMSGWGSPSPGGSMPSVPSSSSFTMPSFGSSGGYSSPSLFGARSPSSSPSTGGGSFSSYAPMFFGNPAQSFFGNPVYPGSR